MLTRFGFSIPIWLGSLFLLMPPALLAQQDLAGRVDPDFRLNLLRTEIVSPYGQQPPYDWSAVYLANAFGNHSSTSSYVLDSSVCGYGVANTTQFGEEIKGYYSYASDGSVSEVLFKEEMPAGTYENFSRKLYTYSNGQRTGYLYQLWNVSMGSWEDEYEEQTLYNADGQQERFSIREIDGTGQWRNLYRESRGYDVDGNLTEILAASWDNGGWLDTAKTTIEYNDIGLYARIHALSWNGAGWDSLSRESADYGEFGMFWDTYLLEEKTQNVWEGVVREQYSYDTYGFWTGMSRQGWNSGTGSWENLLREQYAYTRKGIWTGWSQQVWQDSGWVNSIRQTYSSSNQLRQDIMQTWDSLANGWTNGFRVLAQYDGNFNLVREGGIQSWDPATTDWINTADTRQCVYTLRPVNATAIHAPLRQLDCTMMNPYRVYEPIHCESLQSGKRYELRLTDMQGRTVYQTSVPGGQKLSIDRSLPTGVYSLRISEDHQTHFLRKIIIK